MEDWEHASNGRGPGPGPLPIFATLYLVLFGIYQRDQVLSLRPIKLFKTNL